jgi:hypothetical protein
MASYREFSQFMDRNYLWLRIAVPCGAAVLALLFVWVTNA